MLIVDARFQIAVAGLQEIVAVMLDVEREQQPDRDQLRPLNRNGWKIADFQPGAKVTVYANTSRAGKKNALMRKVILADGREFKSMDIGLDPPPGGAAPAGPPRDSYADYAEYK
jgi:hypothetical protein